MLFLWANRTPGDGVMNYIFRKIFPAFCNPAKKIATRKGVFVVIAFSSENLVNKDK
jgi:hypothetical protein